MTSVARLLDPKSVLLAKHAQHVVLIHFPIALFIVGVGVALVALTGHLGGFLSGVNVPS